MKNLLSVFILAALSFDSLAYDGWIKGKVKSIRQQPSLTLVQMTVVPDNNRNPRGCSNASYYVFRNDNSYADRYNSELMLAFASGKDVHLAVSGCDTWPTISEVWVFNSSNY